LIAALVVVAGAWFLVPDSPRSAPVDDTRVAATPTTDATIVELIAADVKPNLRLAAETPAVLEVDVRASDFPLRPAARRAQSGRLTLSAVDAVTRVPLDDVRVRIVSGTRIADREAGTGATAVVLKLTPDTYTPFVLVPGYEPVELEAVRVELGAELELTAAMHRGSARITGIVLGGGNARHAELTGAGRRPCDRCAESEAAQPSRGKRASGMGKGWSRRDPCAHCGFAADFTRIPVDAAATFAFRDLASGDYALRLTDERGHGDGTSLLVALREAQHVRVEMTAPVLRDVLVNVIDVDHMSLADSWGSLVSAVAAPGHARSVLLESDASARDLAWQVTVFEGSEFFGRGEFLTPTRPSFSDGRPAPFGGRKLGTGQAVDDRTRSSDEGLRPKARAPKFPQVVLESLVREDGLIRIEGVPAHELTIRLKCEPFLATMTVPESIDITTVRALLRRTDELGADDSSYSATFRALDAARYR